MSDLCFDPDSLDDDLTVECRISEGPRHHDPRFDPRPRDEVRIDDGSGEPLVATVVRRDGDRVTVRVVGRDPELLAAIRLALWFRGREWPAMSQCLRVRRTQRPRRISTAHR